MTALRLEWRERRADLILDRPPLNILDLEALAALDSLTAELAAADPIPQVVILRSSSPRAFSAGVAVEDHTGERIRPALETFHRALLRLAALPAISLAAVQGHCLGGGFELALACDLMLVSEDARLGQPEIRLGCFPPFAAAALPRSLGTGTALDLMLRGEPLDGGEALRLGLAQRCVPADRFAVALETWAGQLLGASRPVAHLLKRAVAAGSGKELPAAVAAAERIYLDELLRVADMEEGLAAFRERRAPEWSHR